MPEATQGADRPHCEAGVLARPFALAGSVKSNGRGRPFYISIVAIEGKEDDQTTSKKMTKLAGRPDELGDSNGSHS